MFFEEKSQLIFVYYLELQSQPVLKWIFNDYQATISDVKMGFIVHLIQLFMTGCDIVWDFCPDNWGIEWKWMQVDEFGLLFLVASNEWKNHQLGN